MNKAVKIGIIVLAISAVTATGIILYKRNKKDGNKTAQVALPSGETIKVSHEAAAIIAEAQKWVGVKEIGDNQGWENKELEAKMKTNGGWWKGAPYCACFVKMVIVSVATGKAKEFFKKTLTAAAINTWQKLQNTEYSEKLTSLSRVVFFAIRITTRYAKARQAIKTPSFQEILHLARHLSPTASSAVQGAQD